MYQIFTRGICLIDEGNFSQALEEFNTLTEKYSDHPIGYFGKMVVYQSIMSNYRVRTFESEYDSLLNLIIHIGKEALKKDREDIHARFFLGGAYEYRGMFKARKKDYAGAIADGLKGITELKRVIDLDPYFYDALYGLGLYHYWRSVKTNIAGVVPFFKKGKNRGIREIWSAVRKGNFSTVAGRSSLVYIYCNEGEYQKAWRLNSEIYKRYPDNPVCLYMRAFLCETLKKWDLARDAYTDLLHHIRKSEHRSNGYEAECLNGMALACYHLNDFNSALFYTEEAIEFIHSRNPSHELESPLKDFDYVIKTVYQLKKDILEEL